MPLISNNNYGKIEAFEKIDKYLDKNSIIFIINPNYKDEIIFIDNHSKDNTKTIIKNIFLSNKNVKAIFNAKNFGALKNFYYGLQQTTGDCTILICFDLQDPHKLIINFIKEWKNGYKVIIGKK